MSSETPVESGVRPVGAAAAQAAVAGSSHPLDEVMLAMDVVDTLRRRERLVKTELDDLGREEDLKERLRKIYAAQGIDVPDHVIDQGVAALHEGRFTFTPPPRSLATRLARIYVSRGNWGKWVGGILGVMVLAAAIHYVSFVAPDADLPDDLVRVHTEAVALAENDQVRETLERFLGAGQSALRNDDTEGARRALRELEAARTTLGQEYSLRIVNRPGEQTGVWRVPDVNTGARNYYILVEAVDPTGRVLPVPIRNEETHETETVAIWGLRVDEETFNAVARDKQDDGIVDRDRFGYKARGELVPRYDMPTTGGAITRW
ncbi:DUF6384 family protein [Thiocapsa rosea]|uniref:Uncharacterized protein n=1 Tax=Thiocapsa rosea TaxID=69360 RepID=A0A495V2R0_9GAMM|nr:DUF6384 family protein [Thiocapsa rosea]RKT43686.1 hypothetical protein BDD21_1040 [Thiocapsa rosea]